MPCTSLPLTRHAMSYKAVVQAGAHSTAVYLCCAVLCCAVYCHAVLCATTIAAAPSRKQLHHLSSTHTRCKSGATIHFNRSVNFSLSFCTQQHTCIHIHSHPAS